MKLKELPFSVYYSFKLNFLSLNKLSEKSGDELPVIVSLTTIPSRLSKVHITIRSILSQNPKPKRVILWLNESHQDIIPTSLIKLQSSIFEIRYTHLHCSHKKLIHTLKAYPDQIIVTSDDDCIYRKNWLNTLYQTHLENPYSVIAHRIRCIQRDKEGNFLPYKKWICSDKMNPKSILAVGAEGVLYPPNIFSEEIFDEKLFLKLAPKADDLWFKAMALKNNVLCKPSNSKPKDSIPIIGTQKISLKKVNIDEDLNRVQWETLTKYYDLKID